MKNPSRAVAGMLAALFCHLAAAADADVKAAAERFVAGVAWQAPSVLTGDFSCAGRQQHAILGTSAKEIVVAVFTDGLARAPEVLRFDSEERKAAEAKIRLEDSALTVDEVKTLAGAVAPGYQASSTCKGVRLSDDASDAAHIYWDHTGKRFESWSQ
jgi:hypothetical protein